MPVFDSDAAHEAAEQAADEIARGCSLRLLAI
jgi:hypothetical protein